MSVCSCAGRCIRVILNFLCNRKTLGAVALLWIIFQVLFAEVYHDTALLSDPGYYVYLAQECVKEGTMYPNYSNYYDTYIFNPGIVNLYVLWLNIFGSMNGIWYLFIAMNVAMLILIGKICGLIVPQSRAVAYAAMYLFMILPVNSTIIIRTFSEIPFEFMCMLSFWLTLRKSLCRMVLAGICVALAFWIRPLGAAWILAAVIFIIWKYKSWRLPVAYAVACAVTLAVIAVAVRANFPDYNYTATTGGLNMLMGAYDDADGEFDSRVFQKGMPGYIAPLTDSLRRTPVVNWADKGDYIYRRRDTLTYRQYDSIYTTRAKDWIMSHKVKWLGLMPHKVKALYRYCIQDGYLQTYPRFKPEDGSIYRTQCRIQAVAYLISRFVYNPVKYLFVAFLLFISWRKPKYLYVAMPVVFATGITLIAVVATRYNFIMMPWLYMGASIMLMYIYNILRKVCRKVSA